MNTQKCGLDQLYQNRTVIVLMTILIAIPAFSQNSKRFVTIPSIDVNAQQRHAQELLKRPGLNLAAMALAIPRRQLSIVLFIMVKEALPMDQQKDAAIIARTVIEESRRYGLDPFFVLAQIQTESGFDSTMVGTHGEVGLMQLRPTTAQWILEKQKKTIQLRLTNPQQNIQIGTAYLALLRKQFSKNALAYVSAYNMGPANLRKLLGQHVSPVVYHSKVLYNYKQVYQTLEQHIKPLKKPMTTTVASF
jgi:soluble lytic murein transglycosylase